MADFGLTAAGVSIPRLIDYLDELDARFEADTGIQLDSTNPDNSDLLLVRLNGYVAALLDELGQQAQALADVIDPDGATGNQLRNLARIVGVDWFAGTKGTVTLRCSGTEGTPLPEGQIAAGADRWVSTESATIGALGYADVAFEAEEEGAVPADAGTITRIVTPISGWDSVTNPADATPGREPETDAALRVRMRDANAARAGSGVRGIRSRILALSFVDGCTILANGDSQTQIVQGVTMLPHSVLVVVAPGPLSLSQQRQILGILYDSSIGTVQHMGTDVDGTVVNLDDGTAWPVSFDYGADSTVDVHYTVTMKGGGSPVSAHTALRAAVDLLLPLALGEKFRRLRLDKIAEDTGEIAEAEVLIDGVASDYQPLATERVAAVNLYVNGTLVP